MIDCAENLCAVAVSYTHLIHRFETPGGALMPNILHAPELLAARESAIYQKYVSPVITYGDVYKRQEQNVLRITAFR